MNSYGFSEIALSSAVVLRDGNGDNGVQQIKWNHIREITISNK